MQVINNDRTCFWDIDETLVLAVAEKDLDSDYVAIEDPITKNRYIAMNRHHAMIRLLKEEYSRGSHVIVWSRGGYAWAEAVIRALDLTKEVHLIMSKPMVYFDDLDISEWLKYRVYLKPGTIYK